MVNNFYINYIIYNKYKKKAFVKRYLCPQIIGIIIIILSIELFMFALEKNFLDGSNTDKYIFLWVPIFSVPWILTVYGMKKMREKLMKQLWKNRLRKIIEST